MMAHLLAQPEPESSILPEVTPPPERLSDPDLADAVPHSTSADCDACFLDLDAFLFPTRLAPDYHYRRPPSVVLNHHFSKRSILMLSAHRTSSYLSGDEADRLLLEPAVGADSTAAIGGDGWRMPSLPPLFHSTMGLGQDRSLPFDRFKGDR